MVSNDAMHCFSHHENNQVADRTLNLRCNIAYHCFQSNWKTLCRLFDDELALRPKYYCKLRYEVPWKYHYVRLCFSSSPQFTNRFYKCFALTRTGVIRDVINYTGPELFSAFIREIADIGEGELFPMDYHVHVYGLGFFPILQNLLIKHDHLFQFVCS